MTIASDYNAFADGELAMRKALSYPPYQKLLRIIIGAEEKNSAQVIATRIADDARAICDELGVSLLGPAPAPVEKVRNYWRYHILCKAASAAKLQSIMHRLKRDGVYDKTARIVFDLDPQDML
jgi:primosomal protein N' (replication factor Y)